MSERVRNFNCFGPIDLKNLAPQCKPIKFPTKHTDYKLVPIGKVINEETKESVIEYEVFEDKTYDIQEYIDSFSDDVGIQNILRKLAISGDKSLLNQTGREPMLENGGLEPIQDFSNAPKSKTEAFNQVAAGVAAFDKLPDDLKGKMSLAQFVNLFGQEEFDKYISGIVAKQQAASATNSEEGGNK